MSKESGIDTSIVECNTAAIICSDAESDSSSDDSFNSPPAKKCRRQTFRAAWLKDPQFQPWLVETEHPLQAKCTVCVKFLTTCKSVLRNHAKSVTHTTNMQRNARALISVPSDAATASNDTSVAGPSSAAIICSDAENHSSGEHIFPTASIDTNVTEPSSTAIICSDAESDSICRGGDEAGITAYS